MLSCKKKIIRRVNDDKKLKLKLNKIYNEYIFPKIKQGENILK